MARFGLDAEEWGAHGRSPQGVPRFSIGEEVRYDGRVYVVSVYLPAGPDASPGRYRLLACGPRGTRHVWAEEDRVAEIESYLRSRSDTEEY
jgi:hypothetical protein